MSIAVSIGPPTRDAGAAFADLAERAPANAFVDPTALKAAEAVCFSKPEMMLAWEDGQSERKLVGAWAMRRKSLLPGVVILLAPAFNYAFAGTPVLDPAMAESTMLAFLDAIAQSATLPKVLRLEDMDAESPACISLMRMVEKNGWPFHRISTSQRPIATKTDGIKRSGSTRKKLRQDWSRLSAVGDLAMIHEREPARVTHAFEEFLALEASSWKGKRGTALRSKPRDVAFARRLIGDFAVAGKASVALLRLGERTIAAQVLLHSGRVAFTWKTAFDSEFAKYSPGMLLVDRISDELLSSGEVDKLDSCSPEKSFMAQLWTGRQTMTDLLVEVRPHRSLSFRLALMSEMLRQRLRQYRSKVRGFSLPHLSKPRTPVEAT
ncbi:MAG: hypothetical protein QOD74_1764 [Variibacter sp.]|nr:hypothetical protein [Variibacter sp.]